jgi:hypothetical protein
VCVWEKPLDQFSLTFLRSTWVNCVCGRTDGRADATELVRLPLYPDCARRLLVEAYIMADCDVKKIEKTLSNRFSKDRLNSVSVLERGILLYLIVSCIFKLDRYSKDILRHPLGD